MNSLFTVIGVIIGLFIAGFIVQFEEGTKNNYKGGGIPLLGSIQLITTTSERSIGCKNIILINIVCATIGGFLGYILDKVKLGYIFINTLILYRQWNIPEYLKCVIIIVAIILIWVIIRNIFSKRNRR